MRKFLLAGAAAAATLFAANGASAALLLYSTFEKPDVPFGAFQIFSPPTVVDGWTSYTGDGIEIQDHAAGAPSVGAGLYDGGDQFVELDSNNNSSMFYQIQTSGIYYLTFIYSPRPNVAAGSNVIDVTLDGTSPTLGTFASPGGATTSWTGIGGSFYATAGQKLIFAANGTSDSLGGYVDNISLSGPVPEPATWAMMILGFGLTGSALRRRRSATAFA